ncbi:MAG: cell division protein SepF [Thermaerobacterales bacterium]
MRWYDRVLAWIGFEVVEEGQGEVAATSEEPARNDRVRGRRDRIADREREPERPADAVDRGDRGNLVSLPGNAAGLRMVVLTPRDFEQVQAMADHLKNRRPVLLNLETCDKDVAQRIINFLSGTIYALNGEMHRLATHVLLFAPSNIEIIEEPVPVRPRADM